MDDTQKIIAEEFADMQRDHLDSFKSRVRTQMGKISLKQSEIESLKKKIAECEKTVAEYQKELREMKFTQIDAVTILGGAMSGVMLQGVKLKKIELTPQDGGILKQEGKFALQLGNGMEVGEQSFGGYSDFKLSLSAETLELQTKFYNSMRSDISKQMGLG